MAFSASRSSAGKGPRLPAWRRSASSLRESTTAATASWRWSTTSWTWQSSKQAKTVFDFASSDLGSLVTCIVDEFASLLSEKDQKVLLVSRLDRAVSVDAARILQVLRNLVGNALKFAPSGSEIEIAMEQGEGEVRVAVSDRGVGIPEDELETIFEKFVQSKRTRSGAGGTGLGLPICRQIIGAHGGRIWAENRPGGGSSFVFTLPLQTSMARNPHTSPREAEPAHPS